MMRKQGNADQACFSASKVANIAHQRLSSILKKKMHGFRTQQEPFAQTERANNLDACVCALICWMDISVQKGMDTIFLVEGAKAC